MKPERLEEMVEWTEIYKKVHPAHSLMFKELIAEVRRVQKKVRDREVLFSAARIATFKAQNTKLKEQVREAEYLIGTCEWGNDHTESSCRECGGGEPLDAIDRKLPEYFGHKPDCRLAKWLKDTEDIIGEGK